MSKLVIVESPTKANTIKKFLGKEYKIIASKGHIRDLPKSKLGVDVDHNFEPQYEIPIKASKQVNMLKDEFKKSTDVYLATDEDREGEAISFHIAHILNQVKSQKPAYAVRSKVKNSAKMKNDKFQMSNYKRIVFHEITKDAILHAIKTPRTINMDMVNAQQARRVLDRLVGYKLSPLLWKKISFGLSAGRVQSAALRLIVQKERERNEFKIENYFTFVAKFTGSNEKFISNLLSFKDKKIVTKNKDKNIFLITKKEEAEKIVAESLQKEYSISKITETETNKSPYPPFTTSTLQQAGSNVYGFSASRTMKAAQKLYEHGFITYHRTDSVALSSKFLGMAKDYIIKNFGEKYYKATGFKNKSKNAQEAHEAIRPTKLNILPSKITLGKDEEHIYCLIFTRSIATQMTPIKSLSTSLDIKSIDNVFLYRTTGSQVLFDGWSKIYKSIVGVKYNPLGEDVILPKLVDGQPLKINESKFEEKSTQPPARYSEASLIKTLEKYGIGRPSTYAPTIQTIIARKYVEKVTKYLIPTDLGFVVTKLLEDNFNSIVDYNFTAGVEEDLDNVAKGEKEWTKIVGDFYAPFIKKIEEADGNLKRNDYTVLDKAPKNIKCPDCGGEMIVKLGKLGRFYSCANFPTCKGIRFLNGETNADVEKAESKEFKDMYLESPKTGNGRSYVLKQGRYGMFWAHPDYPKVKDAKPLEMTKGGLLKTYGEIPKTSDGREFTFRQGKFGKYWAHPEYPTVKQTIRIKPEPKKEEDSENI